VTAQEQHRRKFGKIGANNMMKCEALPEDHLEALFTVSLSICEPIRWDQVFNSAVHRHQTRHTEAIMLHKKSRTQMVLTTSMWDTIKWWQSAITPEYIRNVVRVYKSICDQFLAYQKVCRQLGKIQFWRSHDKQADRAWNWPIHEDQKKEVEEKAIE